MRTLLRISKAEKEHNEACNSYSKSLNPFRYAQGECYLANEQVEIEFERVPIPESDNYIDPYSLLSIGDDSLISVLTFLHPSDVAGCESVCRLLLGLAKNAWISIDAQTRHNKSDSTHPRTRSIRQHVASSLARRIEPTIFEHIGSYKNVGSAAEYFQLSSSSCAGCDSFPSRLSVEVHNTASSDDYELFVRFPTRDSTAPADTTTKGENILAQGSFNNFQNHTNENYERDSSVMIDLSQCDLSAWPAMKKLTSESAREDPGWCSTFISILDDLVITVVAVSRFDNAARLVAASCRPVQDQLAIEGETLYG